MRTLFLCFLLIVLYYSFTLIHDLFWVNFSVKYKEEVQLYYLDVDIVLSQHHLLKLLFFPHQNVLILLLRINWPYIYGLFLDSQIYCIDLHVILRPVPYFLHDQFCCKLWNCEVWIQSCLFFFFLRLCLLFWMPFISIWILRSACQFAQKTHLEFLIEIVLNLKIK